MVYNSLWVSLQEAVRILVRAGDSETEARGDLCGAIADREIAVRVLSRLKGEGNWWVSPNDVWVPVDLEVEHIDWSSGRPLAQWRVGPMAGLGLPDPDTWFAEAERLEIHRGHLAVLLVAPTVAARHERQAAQRSRMGPSGRNELEQAAIRQLRIELLNNPDLTREQAKRRLEEGGLSQSARAFQHRIWPGGRTAAGLSPTGKSGRPKRVR